MTKKQKHLRLQFRQSSANGVEAELWENIKARMVDEYHQLVSELSDGQGSPDWWVSSIASRNPFASRLYFRLCAFAYILKIIESRDDQEKLEISVDSYALSNMIKNMLEGKDIHNYLISVHVLIKEKKLFRILKVLFAQTVQFCILRKPIAKINGFNLKTLIDIFILPGWRSGVSRYYGRLLQISPEDTAKKICFAPEFITSNPFELFRQKQAIRRGNFQAIFKQSYLSFKDYSYALFFIRRITQLSFKNASFAGQSIIPLVKEELNDATGYDASVRGLLNYKFFFRLAEQNQIPKKIIGWFENQALDKGWNLGANKFCPSALNFGYQAFSDMPGYFCMFPTDNEHKHGVLPKALAVSGQGWIKSRTIFCHSIPTFVAPAFRFEHVWSPKPNKQTHNVVVLVTLPIDSGTATQMLDVVKAYVLASRTEKMPQFHIKLHPAGKLRADDVLGRFSEIQSGSIQIENHGFEEAIRRAHLLMSTMSSTCLESIACGVPVALYVGGGSEWRAIPTDVPPRFSQAVHDAADLSGAIENLSQLTNADEQKIAAIRSQYFEQPTIENTIDFIQ